MATLKHLSSKSANYGKALEYLMFQHNERTQQPILDANGNMIMREEFYLDGINCHPFSFDKECELVNAAFHKNKSFDEVKSHHYILSFDPKDREIGLTGKRAQALGLEFANRFFPGHQMLVCTHMDGHNGSGNIHVHIILNSVRKLDVEPQDFTERPCDCRAGNKHHQTRDYLLAMKRGIMEITAREGLHQVDLISPAPVKVKEREYWKARREQEKLDELNEKIIADGMTPRTTRFQTQKQFLRDAITEIASYARSEQEFKSELNEKYEIQLRTSRGRYSYLHPDRQKAITGRALGSNFEKSYLLALFAENEKAGRQLPDDPALSPDEVKTEVEPRAVSTEGTEYDPTYDYRSDPVAILFVRSDLHLVVDLQSNIKAQQSAAYAQKVKLSNLKEMAKTVCYIQEHGYDTRDALSNAVSEVTGKLNDARRTLRATEGRIKTVNEAIHYVGQYQRRKGLHAEFVQAKDKKKFRKQHLTDLELYEVGVKYIKEHFDGKVPSLIGLKAERDQLFQMKDAQLGTYQYFKEYQKELHTVSSNVDSILGKERTHQQGREKSQDIS